MIERVYIASVEQSNCLNAVADPKATRDDVAGFYADIIRCRQRGQTTDVAEINRAIITRWSMAALLYVKKLAWKQVGEQP